WHQLVGVHKMLTQVKTSLSVLLMDGVGLRKTIQVFALFAMLAFYRETHKQTGRYPVKWHECTPSLSLFHALTAERDTEWKGKDGKEGSILEGGFADPLADTIYGRSLVAVAFDEAHVCHRVNNLYWCARALQSRSHMFVAMTATPVQNKHSVSGVYYIRSTWPTNPVYVCRTCGTLVEFSG
ncbi:hypothetical protein BV25DRAFT_1813447, partial [Artomyces pyxidatus]